MTKQIGLMGLLALLAAGCKSEKVESEDIRTSGIYAKFEVLATGNSKTSVKARLTVGGENGTIVVLTGEDKLVCTGGTTEKTLGKNGNDYTATFSGEAGDTKYLFAFERSDEDEAAPNSYVTLPAPFTIAGVTATTEVSRASELTVTWDAGATFDPTTWRLEGGCLFATDGEVPTDGTLTLSGDDFDPTPSATNAVDDPNDDSETCQATLCIERQRNGTLDPAFAEEEGGEINAIQRRCVEFTSIP